MSILRQLLAVIQESNAVKLLPGKAHKPKLPVKASGQLSFRRCTLQFCGGLISPITLVFLLSIIGMIGELRSW